MGDTERKNHDEAEMVAKLRMRGYIVTKSDEQASGYQRDTHAMVDLGISMRADGKVAWINVDGVCWLRIMIAPGCHVTVAGFTPDAIVEQTREDTEAGASGTGEPSFGAE